MDNASKNASDMIGSLQMQYNRGRQASITNELVDIITGQSSFPRFVRAIADTPQVPAPCSLENSCNRFCRLAQPFGFSFSIVIALRGREVLSSQLSYIHFPLSDRTLG